MRCVPGQRYRLKASPRTMQRVLRWIMCRETRWNKKKIFPPSHLTTSVIKQGCYQERIQKGEKDLELHIPSVHNKPLLLWIFAAIGSFAVREGLVCPVICYSVNHISGEMDLLACPLQRNEGQPLLLRGHLQHDTTVNVKHQEGRGGKNKSSHIYLEFQRWRKMEKRGRED